MRVGKSIGCPCGDQMPGTEKEEGLRSFFCFVVVSEAGSAHACLKQQECKFTGNCCLSRSHGGTLAPTLCPPGGLFPVYDFIQRLHSLPRHHRYLPENDTQIYRSSLALRRFSLLASLCYYPVLIYHVNNNCKYAIV